MKQETFDSMCEAFDEPVWYIWGTLLLPTYHPPKLNMVKY